MSLVFLGAATLLYALASGVSALFVARGTRVLQHIAMACLTLALVAHLGLLVLTLRGEAPAAQGTIGWSLTLASFALTAGYLVAALRYPIGVLGVFVAPLALLFIATSSYHSHADRIPSELHSMLERLHIGANSLGLGGFALAAVVSVGYIVQERMIRTKRLRGWFARLPPLDTLDRLGFAFVAAGFPFLTIGLVTGAVWARHTFADGTWLSPGQIVGVAAWLVYASVIVLRGTLGWRGRRAAWGTLLGFSFAMIVLTGYLARGIGV